MKKIAIFIFLNFSIYYSNILSAQSQSVFVGGLFPTIDHSGTIVKNLDYSLYYFIALPLVNFENPDITRDANFLLLYLEHALTYKVNKFLSFSGSYVYQRENVIQSNFLNEHRFHIQATVKHPIKSITLKHRLRFDNRFVADRITRPVPYTH